MICASGLDHRYVYFRYNATSGDIVDNTVEQLGLENMGTGIAVRNFVSSCPMQFFLPSLCYSCSFTSTLILSELFERALFIYFSNPHQQ